MPTYSYVCEKCGTASDSTVPSFEGREEAIQCSCGGAAHYDFAETAIRATFARSGDREYISEALGVRPDEVSKTIEEDKKIGSRAEKYLPDGRLVFSSWSQKNKYERDRGYIE